LADYEINAVYFHDNDFLISKKHAADFCNLFISKGLNRKIRWAFQTGTDKVDNDMFRLAFEAGCTTIEFGMESIREEDLVYVNKNRSVAQNVKAIEMCRKHGISSHAYFITGLENETLNDLNSLIEWININKPDTFTLSPLQIHPGTGLYETAGIRFFEDNDWTRKNILNYYSNCSQNDISPDSFSKWKKGVFTPFKRKYHHRQQLKDNRLIDLFKHYYSTRILSNRP
jgi:radical SAM superfamily enzyme YgiQ (UPF0313 family)